MGRASIVPVKRIRATGSIISELFLDVSSTNNRPDFENSFVYSAVKTNFYRFLIFATARAKFIIYIFCYRCGMTTSWFGTKLITAASMS